MTNLLESDFYFFQDQLSDRENESIYQIRDFFETEVRPIANDYWARAEMPHQLIPGIAKLGVFGPEWEESRQFENSALYRGWTGMEMARVDASLTTFSGVQGGLAMGALGVGGSDARSRDQQHVPGRRAGERIDRWSRRWRSGRSRSGRWPRIRWRRGWRLRRRRLSRGRRPGSQPAVPASRLVDRRRWRLRPPRRFQRRCRGNVRK